MTIIHMVLFKLKASLDDESVKDVGFFLGSSFFFFLFFSLSFLLASPPQRPPGSVRGDEAE